MYLRPNLGILPLRSIDADWEKGRLDRHNRETIENSDTVNYHVVVFSHPDHLFPLLQLLQINIQVFKKLSCTKLYLYSVIIYIYERHNYNPFQLTLFQIIVELFILIHPHFNQSICIFSCVVFSIKHACVW